MSHPSASRYLRPSPTDPFPVAGRRPSVSDVESLHLESGEWSADALWARRFADRLRGLRRREGVNLLLDSRRIHTFGLGYPISVVGIDSTGAVVGAMLVPPGRMVAIPGARHILEMPPDADLPAIGATLGVTRG
jgi:hypothetical protein